MGCVAGWRSTSSRAAAYNHAFEYLLHASRCLESRSTHPDDPGSSASRGTLKSCRHGGAVGRDGRRGGFGTRPPGPPLAMAGGGVGAGPTGLR
jgi:hypothetical protein